MNNGGCNQTCVDTTVGYNCSCFSGFQLASDMKNCTPTGKMCGAITLALGTARDTLYYVMYVG